MRFFSSGVPLQVLGVRSVKVEATGGADAEGWGLRIEANIDARESGRERTRERGKRDTAVH